MLDNKEFRIIIQNLTNRAVDIEISDATVEGRKVSFDNVKENITTMKNIVGKEIADFDKKNPPKPKQSFNKWKK
jgi:hypothetical protein